MKFFNVVDLDETDDKDTIGKLQEAYEIIWDNVPISGHGRCDELLTLITPSDAEVVRDFETCCTKAALRLRSGSKGELAVLNEARQICDSILKKLLPNLIPVKVGLGSLSKMENSKPLENIGRVKTPYEIIVNQSNAVYENTGIKPAFVIIGRNAYDILCNSGADRNPGFIGLDKLKIILDNGEECELALVPELYAGRDSISVTPPAGEYYSWLHEKKKEHSLLSDEDPGDRTGDRTTDPSIGGCGCGGDKAKLQADELPQSLGPEQNKAG